MNLEKSFVKVAGVMGVIGGCGIFLAGVDILDGEFGDIFPGSSENVTAGDIPSEIIGMLFMLAGVMFVARGGKLLQY